MRIQRRPVHPPDLLRPLAAGPGGLAQRVGGGSRRRRGHAALFRVTILSIVTTLGTTHTPAAVSLPASALPDSDAAKDQYAPVWLTILRVL